MGSRGIAPLILDLRSRWGVDGKCHASDAISPGEKTRYPLYRRLGGP